MFFVLIHTERSPVEGLPEVEMAVDVLLVGGGCPLPPETWSMSSQSKFATTCWFATRRKYAALQVNVSHGLPLSSEAWDFTAGLSKQRSGNREQGPTLCGVCAVPVLAFGVRVGDLEHRRRHSLRTKLFCLLLWAGRVV